MSEVVTATQSTTPSPSKRPARAVSRRTLWDGDLVSIHVPERAEVRIFDREGEKFTYLAFQFAIDGGKFIDVFVRPAGSELIGTEVEGWLSICEKRENGRVSRYIDIESVDELDEVDPDEPVDRCVTVVPVRASEVEIREGWTFFDIPHPFKRERTLRGAILLYPLGEKVRIRKTVDADPKPMKASVEAEYAEPVAEATEIGGVVLAQAAPEPEFVETNLGETPEPVRMGEMPRKPRSTSRRNTEKKKLVSKSPQVDPARLKELVENGFGMRPQEGATSVF